MKMTKKRGKIEKLYEIDKEVEDEIAAAVDSAPVTFMERIAITMIISAVIILLMSLLILFAGFLLIIMASSI